MIDQQERAEAGASGDGLGAPFSLSAFSKSAFTHHPQMGGGTSFGNCAFYERGSPGVPSLPSMDRPADAIDGLCIGRSCADARGLGGLWSPTSCAGYIPVHCLLLLSKLMSKG